MQALAERIGIPLFIQIIIEIWNGVFLLLMIFSLNIKMQFPKKLTASDFEIPYTTEILVFYNAVFLYNLFNVTGILATGLSDPFSWWSVRISVFMYYLTGAFQTLFFLQLIKQHIAVRNGLRRLELAAGLMQLMHIPLLLLLAVTPFTGLLYRIDAQNRYIRGPLFFLWNGLTLVSFLFIITVYLLERKHTAQFLRQIICTAAVIPVCGMLLNWISGGSISFNNISVSVAAFIIFMFYEKHRTAAAVERAQALDQTRAALAEKQLALEHSQNVILIAQIQPHFINNYLMSLRSRCREYPALYEYVTNFSRYMRTHFNALSEVRMISFEQEMESIEAYLALERENYGDRLRVEYEIESDSFLVPACSVQPLVENAVRHGIATYDGGGTVSIRVQMHGESTRIEITDEGIGQSNITQRQSDRKQIAYDNVRARLRSVSSAQLEITPTVRGTTAAVTFTNQMEKAG